MSEENGFKLQTSREIGILQTDVKNITKSIDAMQVTVDRLESKVDSISFTIARWIGGGAVLLALIEYLMLR